jgi:hypothetical protein
MSTLTERILDLSAQTPEGRPLAAKELLHLGSRAAVDQALSRLVQRGKLLRSGRGLYVRPVESRFGVRPPAPEKVVAEVAQSRGEVIAPHGAVAANALGLTTQVPMRMKYLTSGRNRRLHLGAQTIELQHAPRWMLTHASRQSGEVLRALAWAGPERAQDALAKIKPRLSEEARKELVLSRTLLPEWLARTISVELAAS